MNTMIETVQLDSSAKDISFSKKILSGKSKHPRHDGLVSII